MSALKKTSMLTKKILFFGASAVLLIFVCYSINPYVFSSSEKVGIFYRDDLRDFFVLNSKTFYVQPTKSFRSFRAGIDRHASYPWTLNKPPEKVVWRSSKLFVGIHSASKATPAVDESGVYFGTDLGIFYKFDQAGNEVWKFRTESAQQGIHGSALLTDHEVYFGNYEGRFYCLDKETGNLIWEAWVANAVGSSPILWKDKIIFSAEFSNPPEGYEVALDRMTGKKIWTSDYFGDQIHSSPALDSKNGIIGVGNNNNFFAGFDVDSGHTLWQYETDNEPIKSTAIFVDRKFCFSSWNKNFICLDSLTGKELFKQSLEGRSQSSAAYSAQTKAAYVSSASGYLYKIQIDGTGYERVFLGPAKRETHFSMPSPILLRSPKTEWVLSTCEDTKICVFDAKTLKKINSIDVGGIVTGSMEVYDDNLFVDVDGQGLVKIH